MSYKIEGVELIRAVLREERFSGITCDWDWKELAALAARHGVPQLLYFGIQQLPENERPPQNVCQVLRKYAMFEIFKNERLLYEAGRISRTLEAEGVYHMALKGVNTQKRYKNPVWRSMGDIDILYRAEQTEKLAGTMKLLGYDVREGRKHDHYRKGMVTVEMHRELVAADSAYNGYYADVWQKSSLAKGCRYTYEMTLEDEYIYNLVHLTGHFKNGGIGIRFIMDVYVYEHLKELDRGYVKKELEKLHLLTFYENLCILAENWFGNAKEKNEVTDGLSEYILNGALYGTTQNAAALSVAENGRMGYLIKTCFPNYAEMCSMFPWLEGRKYLLPYSWMLRGIRSVRKRRSNVIGQLAKAKNGDAELGRRLQKFYRDCGL